MNFELLAVEFDKAAIKAEELARLRVLCAVHEIELCVVRVCARREKEHEHVRQPVGNFVRRKSYVCWCMCYICTYLCLYMHVKESWILCDADQESKYLSIT